MSDNHDTPNPEQTANPSEDSLPTDAIGQEVPGAAQGPETSPPEVLSPVIAEGVDDEPVESNRRLFEGWSYWLMFALAIGYSTFHLVSLNIYPLETWSFRIVHIAGALILGYLLFSGRAFRIFPEGEETPSLVKQEPKDPSTKGPTLSKSSDHHSTIFQPSFHTQSSHWGVLCPN